jgi:hypothetical protein
VLSLVRIVPSLVTPHYTLKAAAASLERELGGFDGVVGSRRADGLFIGNALRYRPASAAGAWRPDVLVLAFDAPGADLEAEYRLVTQYDVFVSPRFVPPARGSMLTAGSRLPVRVYVRRAAEFPPMRGAARGG